jgi:hypothetical protein
MGNIISLLVTIIKRLNRSLIQINICVLNDDLIILFMFIRKHKGTTSIHFVITQL